MKSTQKSRPAAMSHAATAGSKIHRKPSHGVQPKPIAEGRGSSAGIASAPRVALQRKQLQAAFGHAIQQQAGPEEEELLQGKFPTLQRQGVEEEDLLQGRFDPVQRQGLEDEEVAQAKFATGYTPTQFNADPGQRENRTGMPDKLKAGIESLSGMSMDDVTVHYDSSRPAQLNALAYTQGTNIHVGPGQEKHLAHEAWHVAQQMQGRVKPTVQTMGVSINDDTALEHEADVMGAKATQMRRSENSAFEFPMRQRRADRSPVTAGLTDPQELGDTAPVLQRARSKRHKRQVRRNRHVEVADWDLPGYREDEDFDRPDADWEDEELEDLYAPPDATGPYFEDEDHASQRVQAIKELEATGAVIETLSDLWPDCPVLMDLYSLAPQIERACKVRDPALALLTARLQRAANTARDRITQAEDEQQKATRAIGQGERLLRFIVLQDMDIAELSVLRACLSATSEAHGRIQDLIPARQLLVRKGNSLHPAFQSARECIRQFDAVCIELEDVFELGLGVMQKNLEIFSSRAGQRKVGLEGGEAEWREILNRRDALWRFELPSCFEQIVMTTALKPLVMLADFGSFDAFCGHLVPFTLRASNLLSTCKLYHRRYSELIQLFEKLTPVKLRPKPLGNAAVVIDLDDETVDNTGRGIALRFPRSFANEVAVAGDIINHPEAGNTQFQFQGQVIYHSSRGSSRSNNNMGSAFWVVVDGTRMIVAIGRHFGNATGTYKITWSATGLTVPPDKIVVLGDKTRRLR